MLLCLKKVILNVILINLGNKPPFVSAVWPCLYMCTCNSRLLFWCAAVAFSFEKKSFVTIENDKSCLKVLVMCLNQLSVPSTTKYVSLRYRDRFINQFPCGHCAECQRLMSLQSSFRANYEFDDLPSNGYVMFDCLSYRNKDLPHLSDFWYFLPKKYDYSCFNRLHIRNFLQTFRQRLIRSGYSSKSVRYFYACEYGTSSGRTHRPHIHLMFYVSDPNISPKFLSALIADVWKYGRTDGVPYKSFRYVISHNVVRPSDLSSRLRTISYITKYLQKKCLFQSVLDKRVNIVMRYSAKYACPEDPDSWLVSELGRRHRLKLLRFVNQFHSSSQQFGASALSDFDFNDLCETGSVVMPSSTKVKVRVPLSTYYKRKMFYELVSVDGCRYWQLNDLGREYNDSRKPFLFKKMCERFTALSASSGIKFDVVALSNYVINERGFLRVSGSPSLSVFDRANNVSFYNYSSCSDKLQFNRRGLSLRWLGSPQCGYLSEKLVDCISLPSFVSKYVYFDSDKEKLLNKLFSNSLLSVNRVGVQKAHELRQRLSDLYKMISV